MSLVEKFTKITIVRDLYKKRIDSLQVSIDGVKAQQEKKKSELAIESEASIFIRRLLESTSEKSLSAFTELLNQCFSAVFFDREFVINYKLGTGKRREIKFFIVENVAGVERVAYFPQDTSGSMNVVFSFILQVFLIQIYDKRKLLLIDEAVSREVSTHYLPYLMKFIESLCKELDFNVLWVTHDERIIPYMNQLYEVDSGKIIKVTK